MTDEAPPSRRGSRRQPAPPEADLDADLWSTPSERTPAVVVPVAAVPGRRPSLATTRPSRSPRTARERLRMERERQARRRRIRRAAITAGLAVLIAAAATVSFVVYSGGGQLSSGYAGPFARVTLNADNSVTMGRPGVTKPVLDIYEDFLCSACAKFEATNGVVLQQLAYQGKVKVVYYPFTLSTSQPQQASSIQAWAAAKCVPPWRWARYHNALFANQPTETAGGGFPASLLVQLGGVVGIANPGFAKCVRSQEYAAQDAPLSDQITNGGVNSAPILKLNGRPLNVDPTSATLRQRILSAR